jgi:hypothetical protein
MGRRKNITNVLSLIADVDLLERNELTQNFTKISEAGSLPVAAREKP